MATVPGSLLLGISSPYARRGALWQAYRDYYAKESDVLVWQAATRAMNSTVAEETVERALERRTARGGRDSIDHAPRGRDDLANVVAGVASLLSRRVGPGWAELYRTERTWQIGQVAGGR